MTVYLKFFKCRQTGRSGFVMEGLTDYYQGEELFSLNNDEVKKGLKGVALISTLWFVSLGFQPKANAKPTLKDRLFLA